MKNTELSFGTIVLLETWLLIVSIWQTFSNPFDEWKWYFVLSIFPIVFGILLYRLIDAWEEERDRRKALP